MHWHRTTEEAGIAQPKAYLIRIAINLVFDALRRYDYPGCFLPGPVLEDGATGSELLVTEKISLVLALALQSMSLLKCTAFVPHDIFSFSHEEVMEFLGRSPPSVRQLASYARHHIETGRSRSDVGTERHHRLTEVPLATCRAGDPELLESLLVEDTTVPSDDDGRTTVALRSVVGVDKAVHFFLSLTSEMTGTTSFESANLNSAPAWIARVDGRIGHVG